MYESEEQSESIEVIFIFCQASDNHQTLDYSSLKHLFKLNIRQQAQLVLWIQEGLFFGGSLWVLFGVLWEGDWGVSWRLEEL